MMTKAIIRRQVENNELTNIQAFTFSGEEILQANMDIQAHFANKMEEAASQANMTRKIEKTELGSGSFIHITTWIKE